MPGLDLSRIGTFVVAVCLLAASLGGAAAAQDTAKAEVSRSDVELRDQLIAEQESLLNVYRCMFDIDTQIVAGGCSDGQPRMGPVEAAQFLGTPSQGELDTRDTLITAQESLLNVYRCMFSIDTQIVPGGCVDGQPDTGDTTTDPEPQPVNETPGDGIRVNMARATWTTGYMQAAIYRTLLIELGYDVSDPAQATLNPAEFYPAMADRQYHFWANGWFPHHDQYMSQADLAGIAKPIGWQIRNGGVQGFLVDKATADAHGITKLDDIGDNPEIAALFDLDGDGKADLMGCNSNWPCQQAIDDTIVRNGWENTIEQVSEDHFTLFLDSLRRHDRDEPILVYVFTPASFTARLVPGTDVIWLSLDNPLPSGAGVADLPTNECPGQPCKTGFTPGDIRVVARNDFLMANPAAAKLFELVTIPAIDIATQVLAYENGAKSEADIRAAARRWIADNRVAVDQWLAAARAAA